MVKVLKLKQTMVPAIAQAEIVFSLKMGLMGATRS
jgi:hypothetical protein